jgi:hypothetical protein
MRHGPLHAGQPFSFGERKKLDHPHARVMTRVGQEHGTL